MRFSTCLTVCAGLALGLTGCGSSSEVWVTCEVNRNGKPYVVPDTHSVQVTFYTLELKHQSGQAKSTSEPYAAAPAGDGKFEVPGPRGRGIPPGKYRISVVHTPRGTANAPKPKSKREAADRDFDFLHDRFGPTSSPIIRTVDENATHFLIDLDQPTG